MSPVLPEVLIMVSELGAAMGVKSINLLPGCWEHQVDEHWWVAVNGHRDAVECTHGVTVSPFSVYLEFNGFPAGIVDAGGGEMAAGGLANETSLLAALRQAIGRTA